MGLHMILDDVFQAARHAAHGTGEGPILPCLNVLVTKCPHLTVVVRNTLIADVYVSENGW